MSAADRTAQRVEELLDRLSASADPAVHDTAEELVRALMEFYGLALQRAVTLLSGRSGNPLRALLDDDITAGVLALHDLHPDDVRARVQRALKSADAAGTEVTAHDPETGTLRLRAGASGGGCGCSGSTADRRERIEAALACHAPEIAAVEFVEAPTEREPVLLQIARAPSPPASGGEAP
ncbi:hypothetical protein [Streptomyces beihaiensis]|uniref:NifU family protein n=1 Tax=Streptomyces beihaiensis TaxID=2984495 RepID=A0ABT3U0V0_9ACTN|nr:hypothetical protein [Streptomyces beihaiensis]MCX3062879.1 hypothetical protein [Streptomyces beihaiensis]